LERLQRNAENSAEFDKNAIEQLEQHAKKEAVSGRERGAGEREKPKQNDQPIAMTKAAKKQAYKKTLSHARRHLSKPEKTLSKVIHQPAIEKVSEIGENTVARSSGLLSGGLFSFAGSLFFLYMAKHYGFAYNFFTFILFLGGGFVVGLFVEL